MRRTDTKIEIIKSACDYLGHETDDSVKIVVRKIQHASCVDDAITVEISLIPVPDRDSSVVVLSNKSLQHIAEIARVIE